MNASAEAAVESFLPERPTVPCPLRVIPTGGAWAQPHAYVVSGPSFVGKSTLGRNLKRMLARHSPRRTCLVELPSLRRMIGPVTYGRTEDQLAYALMLTLTRQALELGMNIVTIAPGGEEISRLFRGEAVVANATQIHVRCSLETVLKRQQLELSTRRRAFVGPVRLREIHDAYRYCRLPWVSSELEFDSERGSSRKLMALLREGAAAERTGR